MNFAIKVDPEYALEVYKYSDVRAFWDEISPLQGLLTHGKADSPNPGFDSVVKPVASYMPKKHRPPDPSSEQF